MMIRAIIILFFSYSAFAETTPSLIGWTNCSYFSNSTSGLNALQACLQAGWTSSGPTNLSGGSQCFGTTGQYQGGNVQCYSQIPTCPTGQGYTLTGVSCTRPDCPIGESYNSSGLCSNTCQASSGQLISSGYYDVGTSPTFNSRWTLSCTNGCLAQFSGLAVAAKSIVGGVPHYFAKGNISYSSSGLACDPSDSQTTTSSSSVPTATCSPNQDTGEVNGRTVCIDRTDTKLPSSTKLTDTTSTTSSTGVKVDISVTVNSDGSTDKTTTTTNPDGSKSVLTTKEDVPVTPFCVSNPTHADCRKQSEQWSNSATPGTFTDNQIAIAAAKQSLTDAFTQVKTEASQLLSVNSAAGVSALPCSSVDVLGVPYSLCFSDYEDFFTSLGSALIGISYLIAAFIMLS